MRRTEGIEAGRPDGRHHRAVAAVLLVLAVLVPAAFANAVTTTPTSTKSGTAKSTGSKTQVESTDAVDWTISLENTDLDAVNGVLTDTIGDGHEYVPGSTKVPEGWTLVFSNQTTGDDFTAPESPAVRRVRAITAQGPVPGSLKGLIAPVPGTFPAATGGDGWVPIVGNPRIFNVYHHTGVGKPEVNCTDRRTQARCAGYPKEVSIAKTDDFFTPFSAAANLDAQGRLWFSGTHDLPGSNDPGGFYCWDTNTDAKCGDGFYPVTDNLRAGTAYVARSPFSGVATNGTKLYALAIHPTNGPKANKIDLECFDTASLAACGTVNMNTASLPGWNNDQYAEGRSPALQMRQIGTKAYFLIDYGANPGANEGLGNRLLCADLTTGGPCAGWTTPAVPGTTGGATLRFSNLLFPDLTGGSSVCVVNTFVTLTFFSQTATRPVNCFNATGGAGPVPAGIQAAVNSVPNAIPTYSGPASFAAAAYVSAEVGTRIFMPFSTPVDAAIAGVNSWALCFDFATGAKCADFGTAGIKTFPDQNKGFVTNYGFSKDQNGCMWGLGDAGWMVSFNAFGNASACTSTGAELTVTPRTSYCGPDKPASLTWNQATLTDIDLSKGASAKISAFEPGGAPVASFQDVPMTNGTASLSALPVGSGLKFAVRLELTDPAAISATSRFQVTFLGPTVQMCLTTKVVSECKPPQNIRNDFEAILDDGTGPSSNSSFATMNVVTPPSCTTTTTSTTSTTTSTSTTSTSTTSTTTTSTTTTTAPTTTTTSTTTSTVPTTTTTTPTTTSSTTTTSTTTTSTTIPETTTTSSTVPETTTTAPPPTVSPETTIRPATTTTTPDGPPDPEVLDETETRELPNTGSNAVPLAVGGLLLLGAGLVLLDLRRKKG
jgi:LPXTG-motif cell wall-anchored protein